MSRRSRRVVAAVVIALRRRRRHDLVDHMTFHGQHEHNGDGVLVCGDAEGRALLAQSSSSSRRV